MSVLSLRRFAYRYPQQARWALREVDLELGPGLHVLTGESGSGKSTLLRVCNGLVPHFHGGTVAGSARLAGADIVATPTRELARTCGFLFQDSELQTVYATVERDVAFGLENLAMPRREMRARVDEALALVGIEHLRTRAVTTLSGGERQRLALAGVLAMRPALLALDEPLAQLDPQSVVPFVSLLRGLAEQGSTVLVSEHRLRHVLPAATTLARVHGGRLNAAASPASLTSQLALRGTAHGNGTARRGPGAVAWSLESVTANVGGATVLSGVELSGRAGEVTVLMGRNGGGKTTLLRTIAGLLAPAGGAVHRTPGRVAYLPQNPTALLHRESVRAEVQLTLRRSGDPIAAENILDALHLQHVARRYPRDLSSGERQRVALAAVLAGSPHLALLDEPTRGMDRAAGEALIAVVAGIRERGGSVVLATHDSELAASVADRVVEVGSGGVHELAAPALVGAPALA